MNDLKSAIKTARILQSTIKIALILGLATLMVFLALHLFVNIEGKKILIRKLENIFKRKVSIGSVGTIFPTYVKVRDIEVKDLFTVEEVLAGGGLFDIFRKDFKLSSIRIIKPRVFLEENFFFSAAEAIIPLEKEPEQAEAVKIDSEEEKGIGLPNLNFFSLPYGRFLSSHFLIKSFLIQDGSFSYTDILSERKKIVIKIEDFNLKIKNLNFGFTGSQISEFELNGIMPWQGGFEKGKISLKGWINLFKRDMQAKLKIENIDGVYLHPYYEKWLDLEKSRIQEAHLQFESDISGHDNDLVAECHLELTDIVFRAKEPGEEEDQAYKVATTILEVFKAIDKGTISLNFTIRTKMNLPSLSYETIRDAFEKKLAKGIRYGKINPQDVVLLPVNLLNDTVEGATNITTALIDGIVQLGSFFTGSSRKEELN